MSNFPAFLPLVFIVVLFLALILGYFIGRMEKRPSEPPPPPPSLLRLSLDAKGEPTLEMDGAPLPRPLTVDQRKRLIALLNLIRPWLEEAVKQASAPPPAPGPAAVAPRPAPPAATPAPRPAPQPTQAVEAEEQVAAPSGIVAQIDAVLQEILARGHSQHAVHLSEAPDGSVQVIVDLKLYKSIEEAPEEIQRLVRQAVAEWEKRQ
ncbi:MAG: hypothetical protein WHS87_09730 [Anaerolineales bacterium]